MESTARLVTATPGAGLRAALDINDNGRLGWPDALAWLFFATVGVLGVAVVVGTVFVGAAATVHGIVRIGRATWDGVHRSPREGR